MESVHATLKGLAALARRGTLSIILLLCVVQVSSAVTILSDVDLTVANDDTVTVTSNGTSQFFGNVGEAGSYGFMFGWGVSSGQVT